MTPDSLVPENKKGRLLRAGTNGQTKRTFCVLYDSAPAADFLAQLSELSSSWNDPAKIRGCNKSDYYDIEGKENGYPPLYQTAPCFGRSDDKPSWTFSHCSYVKAANKLASELIENAKSQKYQWYAVVRIDEPLTIPQHKETWQKAARKLKGQLTCLYVRESTSSHRLEYNLLICNPAEIEKVRNLLDLAFNHIKTNIHIKPVTNMIGICNYITKAKVQGDVEGTYFKDRYQLSRRLFTRKCGLSKHGTIGEFFKDRKQIKQLSKQRKAKHHETTEQDQQLRSEATTEERELARRLAYLTRHSIRSILPDLVRARKGSRSGATADHVQ